MLNVFSKKKTHDFGIYHLQMSIHCKKKEFEKYEKKSVIYPYA